MTNKLAPLVLLIAACAASADAELVERDWRTPGDGLLTYDPVAGLEWLDVSQTMLEDYEGGLLEERFQAVVTETLPGGRFEGFSVATREQANSLTRAAGITLGTNDFAINGTPVLRLMELVGVTRLRISPNGESRRLNGLLDSTSLVGSAWLDLRPTHERDLLTIAHGFGYGREGYADAFMFPYYEIATRGFPEPDFEPAVFLARPAPEPGAATLAFFALVAIGAHRRRGDT